MASRLSGRSDDLFDWVGALGTGERSPRRPRRSAGPSRPGRAAHALQAEPGFPATLDPLEPRMLLSADLLWSLADPGTVPLSSTEFGESVATDGNLTVVGAPYMGSSAPGYAYVINTTTGVLVARLVKPAPAGGDRFGYSVAISGSTVVVGAPSDDTGATDSGSAYIFDAITGKLLHTLNNPTPASGDCFGSSVAISGSTVIVGAYSDNTGGTDCGSAYIFDAATGSLLRTLTDPTPHMGDDFGSSVAVSGSTVVVGAQWDDVSGVYAGSAFVFDAASGNLLSTLRNPHWSDNDYFGRSVAISGSTVVVGAYGDIDTAHVTESGSAYVFDAGTGALRCTLIDPAPTSAAWFGYSVAISGNNVVVGAMKNHTGTTFPGAAYVFDAGTGNLRLTLSDPTPLTSDEFGSSVAISGNTIAVGAISEDTGAKDAGSAYVFDAIAGTLLRTLPSAAGSSGDLFGSAVAAWGNIVVVGAPYDDTVAADSGAAYILDAATGNLLRTLSNPTPASMDRFGWSVAISGNTVVVGAPYDDTGATDSGLVYIFDVATGNLLRTLNNPTPASTDDFGYCVGVAGSFVVVGDPYDDTGKTNSGSAYIFDAGTGSLLWTLSNPTPASSDNFGNSVAIAGSTLVVGAMSDDTGAANAGSAYVFDAATGNLLRTLNNPTPEGGDAFGTSVAISGSNVVVGTPNDNTGALSTGSAYVFDAGTGNLLRTFNNPTPADYDAFGTSVAVWGGTVSVGAKYDDTGATNAGSAYLFDVPTGMLLQTMNDPAPQSSDYFSYSLAASSSVVVVGDPHVAGVTNDRGVAYVYAENQPYASFTATPSGASPAQAISFNAAASSHTGPAHSIVSYEWDFNSDGVYDATGATVSHAYGRFGSFTATLRVTDDNTPPKTATTTVTVNVNQGNRAPVARAGGPYRIGTGENLVLDASTSSDPDQAYGDAIVSYQWDLDHNGTYEVSTASATPVIAWSSLAGLPTDTDLPIGLRVTDGFGVTGTASATLYVEGSPTIVSFVRNGGLDRPDELTSVAVRFSQDVSSSLTVNGLSIHNDTTGVPVNLTGATMTYVAATNTGQWDLSPLALGPGYYTITVSGQHVTNTQGQPLGGAGGQDYVQAVMVALPGDADLDGRVGAADMLAVEGSFGQALAPWAAGDFDHDGTVGFMDYLAVKANYGVALPGAPSGPLSAEPAGQAVMPASSAVAVAVAATAEARSSGEALATMDALAAAVAAMAAPKLGASLGIGGLAAMGGARGAALAR